MYISTIDFPDKCQTIKDFVSYFNLNIKFIYKLECFFISKPTQ